MGSYCNAAERRLGQLRAELAYTQAEDVVASGLHEFVDDFQTTIEFSWRGDPRLFFRDAAVGIGRAGTDRLDRVQSISVP